MILLLYYFYLDILRHHLVVRHTVHVGMFLVVSSRYLVEVDERWVKEYRHFFFKVYGQTLEGFWTCGHRCFFLSPLYCLHIISIRDSANGAFGRLELTG